MKMQRGGFVIGLVVGLLVGLSLALGAALYITKTPIPFMNKVPQRTAEQDNAEAERNKNWDPNAALGGKAQPPRTAAPTAGASAPPVTPPVHLPHAMKPSLPLSRTGPLQVSSSQPSGHTSTSRSSPWSSNTMELCPACTPLSPVTTMAELRNCLPVMMAPKRGSPDGSRFSPWAKRSGTVCGGGAGRSTFLSVIRGCVPWSMMMNDSPLAMARHPPALQALISPPPTDPWPLPSGL